MLLTALAQEEGASGAGANGNVCGGSVQRDEALLCRVCNIQGWVVHTLGVHCTMAHGTLKAVGKQQEHEQYDPNDTFTSIKCK